MPAYFPSNIYMCCYVQEYVHVYVYVSQNNNYDWCYVNDLEIYNNTSLTMELGYAAQQFRYIAIAVYNESWNLGALYIDCVTTAYA